MSEIIHITQEERARLREQADKSYLLPLDEDEVPSVGFDGLTDDRIAYIAAACNSVPRLLNALEAAEAENARLRKMVDWLADANATTCELFLPTNFRSDPEIWKESARQAVTAVEGEENE